MDQGMLHPGFWRTSASLQRLGWAHSCRIWPWGCQHNFIQVFSSQREEQDDSISPEQSVRVISWTTPWQVCRGSKLSWRFCASWIYFLIYFIYWHNTDISAWLEDVSTISYGKRRRRSVITCSENVDIISHRNKQLAISTTPEIQQLSASEYTCSTKAPTLSKFPNLSRTKTKALFNNRKPALCLPLTPGHTSLTSQSLMPLNCPPCRCNLTIQAHPLLVTYDELLRPRKCHLRRKSDPLVSFIIFMSRN